MRLSRFQKQNAGAAPGAGRPLNVRRLDTGTLHRAVPMWCSRCRARARTLHRLVLNVGTLGARSLHESAQISCKLLARRQCPRYKFLDARNTFTAAIGEQNDGQGSFFIDSHAPLLRCERCQNGLWAPFCAPRSPPLYGACTRKWPSEGRNRHLAPTGASQIQANSRSSRYLV